MPAIFFVDELMIAFTSSGEYSGCCCKISATVPDAMAAACDVPLPRK